MDEMELREELEKRWPWNLAMAAAEASVGEKLDVFRVYVPGVLSAVWDAGLSDRELVALDCRYKDGGMTLEECGNVMGVSRERARQVISRALRKVARPECARQFVLDTKHRTEPLKARAEALAGEAAELRAELDALKEEVMGMKGAPERARENRETPLGSLGLSVRSYNCLHRAGVETLADFDGWTVARLMKVRNLGAKSLEEILTKLGERGVELPEK